MHHPCQQLAVALSANAPPSDEDEAFCFDPLSLCVHRLRSCFFSLAFCRRLAQLGSQLFGREGFDKVANLDVLEVAKVDTALDTLTDL